MKRDCTKYLQDWLSEEERKPLIIRGARQVGKTWLVRQLAKLSKKQLIELNLEKQPQLASLFVSNNPQQILLNLSAIYNKTINPKESLLFIDEIQAVPELLSKLRWFAEDLPTLPVITAGSLLDFVLADHSFSMPVGRISYVHLEPLSFEEFLLAHDKKFLCDYLADYHFEMNIPLVIHEQLMTHFKEYILVGGMPAVVSSWATERLPMKVNQLQHDLLATYRDDFAKYSGRMSIARLEEIMVAVPKHLGQKFIYRHINPLVQTNTLKHALDLLHKARICHRIVSSAANGVPLAAEANEKHFKEILLDVGLSNAVLGLTLHQLTMANELALINKGGIAEQVVGQLLRTMNPAYVEPALYYWHREVAGASAEIDFVLQHGSQIIPIEVKSGSTGSLKSLHLFMSLKKFPTAIRINSDLPSKTAIKIKTQIGKTAEYNLLSLPFYLLSQAHRLVELTQSSSSDSPT